MSLKAGKEDRFLSHDARPGQDSADSPERGELLFLCQTLPFPPDGGVNIRSFNLLRLLAREYRVTALCFVRGKIRGDEEEIERSLAGLSDYAEAEAFPIPQEKSKMQLLWDHVRSLVLGRVYTHFAYDSATFRHRLKTLTREREFQLCHMDSLDLSAYLKDIAHLPVVCGHHNVESDLLRARSRAEENGLKARYMRHQATLMERMEKGRMPNLTLNLACSALDAERLREIAPGAAVSVIPNGVDTRRFQPRFGGRGGLVFVGGYTWFPNRDGMRWFAEEILPLIRRKLPEVAVTWVGRAPESVRREFQTRFDIQLTGYVENIQPYVGKASVFIVPLRVGSGTRLKILDAWAMGKALVSTSVGCEGLEARHQENILIRDTPEAFAEGVTRLLSDTDGRSRLEHAARETAERLYDWEVIGEELLRTYSGLLEEK